MAEPKREEERVIPIDWDRGEREGDTPQAPGDSASGGLPANSDVPLTEELARLKAEKEELLQTMIRRQADFENFRNKPAFAGDLTFPGTLPVSGYRG